MLLSASILIELLKPDISCFYFVSAYSTRRHDLNLVIYIQCLVDH